MEAGDGAGSFCLQKFKLYETRSKFYMIGWDKARTIWKVLSIDRLEPSELNIREDPAVYTETECEDLLNRIHNGNRSIGGLRFVTQCYGIIGFVKFLGPYYLLLITKRQKIGSICGHAVFAISKSKMIAIPNSTVWPNMPFSKDENRSFVNFFCNKYGMFHGGHFVWKGSNSCYDVLHTCIFLENTIQL